MSNLTTGLVLVLMRYVSSEAEVINGTLHIGLISFLFDSNALSHDSASSSIQKNFASASSSARLLTVSGSGVDPSRRKFRMVPKCLPHLKDDGEKF